VRSRSLLVLALAVALSAACAPSSRVGPRTLARAAPALGTAAAAGAAWTYEVIASERGETLAVEATFPPGTGTELTVSDGAEAYVQDVVLIQGARRTPIPESRRSWTAPGCASGCVVTYRYDLAAAANARSDRSVAQMHGEAIQAPPSSWLLRPAEAPMGIPFRFHVKSAPGEAFAAGVFPSEQGAPDTYEGRTDGGFDLPYAAFGKIRRIQLAGGHVEAVMFPGTFKREAIVIEWIERSARAVQAFYGHFPISRVLLLVQPTRGRRVGFGTTMGSSGAAIEVPVGEDVTVEALQDDWMLVHEMIHTALPDVTREHHWLEEGLATYAEPLARAHAQLVTPDQLWKDWILGMPKGEPAEGDEGLDRTHTWGRTYWGGALFCLEADVAIRERTGGKRSLVDALRAIVAQGGNISVSWPVERVLDVGDAATGVPVLRETYARMARQPGPVDLPQLWAKLGVRLERGTVIYNDAAPLASIRRAMTEPMKP